MSDQSDFNGTFGTIADSTAMIWSGGGGKSVYMLSESIALDKDTEIKYTNAFGGRDTASQNRYLTFKDSAGRTVFFMYYSWAVLYIDSSASISAFSATNKWSDIVIKINAQTGLITVSRDDKSMQTTVDISKLTDISSIELSSASGCPSDRLLGIGSVIISQ